METGQACQASENPPSATPVCSQLEAVYDLHRLLLKSGIPPPYVLVGHSLGGVLVRVYASQYSEDVAGLVLVDTAPENSLMFINGKWVREIEGAKGRPVPPVKEQMEESDRSLVKEELEGYQKFREWLGPPKIEPPYTKLPPHLQELRLWAMSLPESNVTDFNPFNAEELVILFADRLRREFPLGNKPLVILTRKAQALGVSSAADKPSCRMRPSSRTTVLDGNSRRLHLSMDA